MTDPLAHRFERLLDPGTPDWRDVRRRARRSRRPLVLAVAAVALLVSAPALAIALRGGVLPWEEAEPAPAPAVHRFEDFERAIQARTVDRIRHRSVLAGLTIVDAPRIVPLGNGAVAYVAPNGAGGFCALYDDPADPRVFASSGCSGFANDSPAQRLGVSFDVLRGYLTGHVAPPPDSTLELRYTDGSSEPILLTWVSPPINAGLFFVKPDSAKTVEALVLRDGDGEELERTLFGGVDEGPRPTPAHESGLG